MATIEERAQQYATKKIGGRYTGGFKGAMWQAAYSTYVEIATEQHKIDTENETVKKFKSVIMKPKLLTEITYILFGTAIGTCLTLILMGPTMNKPHETIVAQDSIISLHEHMIDDMENHLWEEHDCDLPMFDGDYNDLVKEQKEILEALRKLCFLLPTTKSLSK